ncbi:MAG: hypothetical protein ACUVR7_10910 [Armatimonadota bacterium]
MRMMRWAVALAGVWALGVMLWTPAQQSPTSLRHVVFVGRDVVFVAPRQMVALPQVAMAEWSPSGRYLVAVTVQARWKDWQSEPEVLGWVASVWDNTRQQVRQVGKGVAGDQLEQFHWLGRSESAVALVLRRIGPPEEEQFQRVLVLLNAPQASLKTLATVSAETSLIVSPVAPMAILVDNGVVRLLRADGTSSDSMPLPVDVTNALRYGRREWSRDGRQLFWQDLPNGDWHTLDLTTGTITSSASPPQGQEQPAEQPKQALRIRVMAQSVGTGEYQAQTNALWLEGEKSRALVCADVEFAKLSPRGDALFYVTQGAGFVAPLLRAPREVYEQARREAEQTVIVTNARQIALALLMYVQDYDERFPMGSMNIQSVLMPYLKNETVFNFPGTNFVYLMDGQPLQSIDRPAETMVGYIQAPGGRAVIWADGHVTWQSEEGGAP